MKATVRTLVALLFAGALLAGCGGGSDSGGSSGPRTSPVRTVPPEPPTPSRAELKAAADQICRKTLPILTATRREIAADRRTVKVAPTARNRLRLSGAYRRYSQLGQAEVGRLRSLRGPEKASYGLFLVSNNMNPAFISAEFIGNSYERGFASVIRDTEHETAEVRKRALEATRSFGLDDCARQFR